MCAPAKILGLILLTFLLLNIHRGSAKSRTLTETEEKYREFFAKVRHGYQKTVNSLLKNKDTEAQIDIFSHLGEKLFGILIQSRGVIESSGFIPGFTEFPADPVAQMALTDILENTALFSELLLRLPVLAKSFLEINHIWKVYFEWGLSFSISSGYFLDSATKKMFYYASQEMLDPKDRGAKYVNPYEKNAQRKALELKARKKIEEKRKKNEAIRKSKPKGIRPRVGQELR